MRRRGFLAALGAGTLAWPRTLEALTERLATGGAPDDEEYWALVRQAFLISRDRIYLNNGTLGAPPRVVVEAVAEHARRVAATFPPGVRWEDLKEGLGEFLGGDPEGFVLPRNTTEAMSFVANGLDLSPGDEIVITDHEHIGGKSAWELAAARRRAVLRVAALPAPAGSSDALFEAVAREVTSRTRVLALSHITFTTGTRLPVIRLSRFCRDRGIFFAVDGAHPPGMIEVDLNRIGADFYASSPHKWMLAPQGTGLLYLGPQWRTELWPTLASGGWADLELGAHRFNHLGTLDESRLAGLLAATEFLGRIRMERIEERIDFLSGLLYRELASIPNVGIASSPDAALRSGMTSFQIEGVDSLELQVHLSRTANVRTRVIGEYGYGWMRLSTHIYNNPRELETVLELLDGVARRGLPGGE